MVTLELEFKLNRGLTSRQSNTARIKRSGNFFTFYIDIKIFKNNLSYRIFHSFLHPILGIGSYGKGIKETVSAGHHQTRNRLCGDGFRGSLLFK